MVGNKKEIIDFLLDKDNDTLYELEEYKEKRSNNANRYMWKLIVNIANKLRSSKEEVYLQMLKRYGQSEMISVLSSIDVSRFLKYYEPVATVELQGKKFTHYRVYTGSSEYDTREMSILIDGIISECEQMGLETLPPNEMEHLRELLRKE